VDLRGFIRRFDLPTGFTAPSLLAFDDIRAYAITREHLRDDVAGINATAHRALLHWLDTEFPFTAPFWSNVEIPQHGS
jgi:hypothetical protein